MSQLTFSVRPARVEDAARLTDLSVQLGYPVSQAAVQQCLEGEILPHPDHALFVAETADGEVIGWAHAYIRALITDPPNIELGGLVVDERYRSCGVGAKLVQRVENWARGRGVEAVFVRSNLKRERAHKFYQHIGYTVLKTSLTFHKWLREGKTDG
jgi:GNAT superfamily N-acetyltransferase